LIRLSVEQARRAGIGTGGRPHKYHAQPTTIDGIRFDSKKEATRYGWLLYRQKIGEITDLRWQVRYPITVTNIETGEITDCGAYVADFVYRDAAGTVIVEDVKGYRTPLYRLKCKLVEGLYGITITER
jgi:hypothetical protein